MFITSTAMKSMVYPKLPIHVHLMCYRWRRPEEGGIPLQIPEFTVRHRPHVWHRCCLYLILILWSDYSRFCATCGIFFNYFDETPPLFCPMMSGLSQSILSTFLRQVQTRQEERMDCLLTLIFSMCLSCIKQHVSLKLFSFSFYRLLFFSKWTETVANKPLLT